MPDMYSLPLPVHFLDGWAVAPQPSEIDMTNAGIVTDTLLALLNRGTPAVVADMTGTRFCDAAGMRAVLRAHRRAEALDASLAVVIAHPAARRVFTITGADTQIHIYPSLAQALASRPGTATGQRNPVTAAPRTADVPTGIQINPAAQRGRISGLPR